MVIGFGGVVFDLKSVTIYSDSLNEIGLLGWYFIENPLICAALCEKNIYTSF